MTSLNMPNIAPNVRPWAPGRVAVSREAPRQEALSKGPCGVKSKNERQGEAIAFGKADAGFGDLG